MRHQYVETTKHYGGTSKRCGRCGIVKMERHAYGTHWTEWWRDGKPVAGGDDPRPECSGMDKEARR